MARGGYQRPSEPSSVSGVGRNSKRTDGRQAIKSPNVQDSTDLTQGDRERIRQGQRIAPLAESPAPRVAPVGPSQPSGQGAVSLPEHVLSLPSTRPEEDEFAPASQPDPTDEMEVVLSKMVEWTGDASIAQMLEEHREFKSWRAQRQQAPQPSSEVMSQPVEPDEPIGVELPLPGAGEESLDQELSVESPAPEGGEDVGAELLPSEARGDAEMV